MDSVGQLLAMVLLLLDSVISICTPSKPLTVFVTLLLLDAEKCVSFICQKVMHLLMKHFLQMEDFGVHD